MLKEANEEACLEGVVVAERHCDFERIADETNEAVSHGNEQNETETRIDPIDKLAD